MHREGSLFYKRHVYESKMADYCAKHRASCDEAETQCSVYVGKLRDYLIVQTGQMPRENLCRQIPSPATSAAPSGILSLITAPMQKDGFTDLSSSKQLFVHRLLTSCFLTVLCGEHASCLAGPSFSLRWSRLAG